MIVCQIEDGDDGCSPSRIDVHNCLVDQVMPNIELTRERRLQRLVRPGGWQLNWLYGAPALPAATATPLRREYFGDGIGLAQELGDGLLGRADLMVAL
jgi:hypothetical protein